MSYPRFKDNLAKMVQDARQKVQSCLVGNANSPGLNPRIGDKVLAIVDAERIDYLCNVSEMGGAAKTNVRYAGGWATFGAAWDFVRSVSLPSAWFGYVTFSPVVFAVAAAPGQERDMAEQTMFHEWIHVADQFPGARIDGRAGPRERKSGKVEFLSNDQHGGSSPDVVYACELACYKSFRRAEQSLFCARASYELNSTTEPVLANNAPVDAWVAASCVTERTASCARRKGAVTLACGAAIPAATCSALAGFTEEFGCREGFAPAGCERERMNYHRDGCRMLTDKTRCETVKAGLAAVDCAKRAADQCNALKWWTGICASGISVEASFRTDVSRREVGCE